MIACAVLALPVAAADPCPECPFTGPDPDNSWDELKVGSHLNDTETSAAHAGLALSKAHDAKGPWAWFGLCLDAVLEKIDKLTGLHTRAHADVGLYASGDGVDLDAHAAGQSFDKLPVAGKLDDATWQAAAKLRENGVETPRDAPVGADAVPTEVVKVCVTLSCSVTG